MLTVVCNSPLQHLIFIPSKEAVVSEKTVLLREAVTELLLVLY